MSEFWFDEKDEKFRVEFSIRGYGRTQKFSSEYDDCVQWHEILDDVVKTLEASYGYSFNLPDNLGVYYPGKTDDE